MHSFETLDCIGLYAELENEPHCKRETFWFWLVFIALEGSVGSCIDIK